MLLALARGADDLPRRVEMVRALTELVVLVRQHVRKFLPELTALVNEFWSGPGSGAAPAAAMVPHLLALLAELSREQRQQVASHPEPVTARDSCRAAPRACAPSTAAV